MSIPVLTQVSDEVRRLSIAGSAVAAGDFRLKKLVPPLEQSGQKAPVFAKIAQTVTQVIDSNEKTAGEALLELSTLANAVLYTQGETGLTGKLEKIDTIDLGQQQSQTSARLLKSVMQALSETGSGRLDTIKEAFERETFRDLRMVNAAVKGLDDPYPDIADFISEKVLPLYGQAILPELREQFNLKGKGGHIRRLKMIHKLDPQGSRELIKQALEEGSKEVRVGAIGCLGDAPEDLPFLLEQAKAKAQDVRLAALRVLGNLNANEAVKVICDIIKGLDSAAYIEAIRNWGKPVVLDCLAEQARERMNNVLIDKSTDKAKSTKLRNRLMLLIECFRNRTDAVSSQCLLDLFSHREALAKLKGEPSGADIIRNLIELMSTNSPEVRRTLIDAHKSLSPSDLESVFSLAINTDSPQQVFDQFSAYLTAEQSARSGPKSKYVAISGIIQQCASNFMRSFSYSWVVDIADKMDPRWLDLALELNDEQLVLACCRPNHTLASKFIAAKYTEVQKKVKDPAELLPWIRGLIRVEHPSATDAVLDLIKRCADKQPYVLGLIGGIIPRLPKSAIPQFEAILPTLSDKAADQIIEGIAYWKSLG